MRKDKILSVLNDGSSSAKTSDEKEVVLIKIAPKGKPDNDEFDRKTRKISMCSDGAEVNFSFNKLLKPDIGEHYLYLWCQAHSLELGVQNSSEISSMNAECKQFCINIYSFQKS